MPTLANSFLLWAFWLMFSEPVGNLLLIQGKLLRISNLLLRLKYFPKTLFFCPTTTYSGLCSSGHPCINNLFLVVFLGRGVIYLENTFELRQSPPKIMYTRIDFRGTNGHTKNRQRKKHSASFQIYSTLLFRYTPSNAMFRDRTVFGLIKHMFELSIRHVFQIFDSSRVFIMFIRAVYFCSKMAKVYK